MPRSRRYHRKSRNGCLECKRRHIRCDETHPVCANCGAAEIRCSFLSGDEPYIVPVFSTASPSISPSAAAPRSSSVSTAGHSTTASTPSASLYSADIGDQRKTDDPYDVNMAHLELYQNLSTEDFLSHQALKDELMTVPGEIYMKYAHTTPYLMHQILAISALYLSIRKEESRRRYLDYATGLQSRAISLFHESHPVLEVAATNFAAMFLFSSAVAAHLFCEALYYHRDTLEGFVERFTHDVGVYRGVIAVVGNLGHLREMELAPGVKMSQLLLELPEPTGLECDGLREMISVRNLAPSAKQAYLDAVFILQQGFDVNAWDGKKPRMSVVFGWPIMVPPYYVDLLRQRQPEALAILAHYAVILHCGRQFWLIGETSGRFIIESIWDTLGPDWHQWLEFPKRALEEL